MVERKKVKDSANIPLFLSFTSQSQIDFFGASPTLMDRPLIASQAPISECSTSPLRDYILQPISMLLSFFTQIFLWMNLKSNPRSNFFIFNQLN